MGRCDVVQAKSFGSRAGYAATSARFHSCVIGLLAGPLVMLGCGGAESKPAHSASEQTVSVMEAPAVGAERGEAEPVAPESPPAKGAPLEGPMQLRVRVDLGASHPLPDRSLLRLELSDMTDKDAPKPIVRHDVDVSTQHGAIEVAIPVDGKKLDQAERVALTGRIDGPTKMLSISILPLVIAGPFASDNGFVESRQVDTFELDLDHVPGYEKPKVARPTSVPVVAPVREVDTGTATEVAGPESE